MQRYLGYVGMTERPLQDRFEEYLTEASNSKGRPKLLRILNKWADHLEFCYLEVKDPTKIEPLERRLYDAYLPPFNSQFSTHLNRIVNAF
jgi:hypothetical protein